MLRTDLLLLATSAVLLAGPLGAQSSRSTAGTLTAAPARPFARVLQAARIGGAEPEVDGRIDDAAWASASLVLDQWFRRIRW